MLFSRLKQLLRHFGFQLQPCSSWERFLNGPGSNKPLCQILEDRVLWFLPQGIADAFSQKYNQNPLFSVAGDRLESLSTQEHQVYHFGVKVLDYDQLLALVAFLQGGFVEGFYLDGFGHVLPGVVARANRLVNSAGGAEEMDVFLKALESDPDSALLNNYVGKLFEERGETDKAASCFVTACEKEPFFAEPYSNMGALMWNAGIKDKAFNLFSEALIRKPFDETIQDNFLKAGLELHEYDRMETAIARARTYFPEYDDLLYVRAELLFAIEKGPEAVRVIEDLLEKQPHHHRAQGLLEEIKAKGK